MQSTISLFRHLYENLPPLFPNKIKEEMGHALMHLEKDQTVSLAEIEKTMVKFGYEVWPWNQAYREFLALAENEVGEHFLLPKLSAGLQDKYLDFTHHGGTLRDLHSGNPAEFFESEERTELCVALVNLQRELREYVRRQLVGVAKTKYLRRVNEFKALLGDVERILGQLRELADREQDHPLLADQIRAQVVCFEHGLCLLGPELDYDAVCRLPEFFAGRRQELDRLKGIHQIVEVDFYGENV